MWVYSASRQRGNILKRSRGTTTMSMVSAEVCSFVVRCWRIGGAVVSREASPVASAVGMRDVGAQRGSIAPRQEPFRLIPLQAEAAAKHQSGRHCGPAIGASLSLPTSVLVAHCVFLPHTSQDFKCQCGVQEFRF